MDYNNKYLALRSHSLMLSCCEASQKQNYSCVKKAYSKGNSKLVPS